MGKIRPLGKDLQKLAEKMINQTTLPQIGIEIIPLGISKANFVTKAQKASEVTQYLAKKDNAVIMLLYEDAFNKVDEKTQELWIESALSTISYDDEKDKISTTVPMITIPIDMYHKFKNIAVNAAELAVLTLQGIAQEEKDAKEAKKAEKEEKKRLKQEQKLKEN